MHKQKKHSIFAVSLFLNFTMKIIIAGAGDVGFHLAKLLSYEAQDTYVIDFDGEKLEYLNNHLDVITKKVMLPRLNY